MTTDDRKFPTALDTGTRFALAVCVGRETIRGATVSEYLVNVLHHIDSRGLLSKLKLPFHTSGDNYLVARTPFHSSGVPFAAYVKYDCLAGGKPYFVNTNHPRFFGLRQGARILEAVGLDIRLPAA